MAISSRAIFAKQAALSPECPRNGDIYAGATQASHKIRQHISRSETPSCKIKVSADICWRRIKNHKNKLRPAGLFLGTIGATAAHHESFCCMTSLPVCNAFNIWGETQIGNVYLTAWETILYDNRFMLWQAYENYAMFSSLQKNSKIRKICLMRILSGASHLLVCRLWTNGYRRHRIRVPPARKYRAKHPHNGFVRRKKLSGRQGIRHL